MQDSLKHSDSQTYQVLHKLFDPWGDLVGKRREWHKKMTVVLMGEGVHTVENGFISVSSSLGPVGQISLDNEDISILP